MLPYAVWPILGVFHSRDLYNPDSTDQWIRSKEPDLTDPDHDLSDLMKRWIREIRSARYPTILCKDGRKHEV